MENELIRLEDLENLSWTTFRNGKASWIYTDKADKLSEKMKARGGSIRLGNYIYEFKKGGKFIVRFPARKGKCA